MNVRETTRYLKNTISATSNFSPCTVGLARRTMFLITHLKHDIILFGKVLSGISSFEMPSFHPSDMDCNYLSDREYNFIPCSEYILLRKFSV